MQRFGELAGPLTPEVIETDAATYVNYLATQHSVSAATIGAVGYCFAGQMALRTAAARPDRIGAIASFHGGAALRRQAQQPASGARTNSEGRTAALFCARGEGRLDAASGD